MDRGIFFLVAGPAGVGKTTLLKKFVAEQERLVKAVSVTTRAPRAGETDGVAYHFWEPARFGAAAEKGEFLEHANVHGQHYGTLAAFINQTLDSGADVVKDIDVQGVGQVRRLPEFGYPATVAIFILPPSREELVRRLEGRHSESCQSLAVRLKNAEAEMARVREFEYVVVNDTVEAAVARLKAIRVAERCRTERLTSPF